MEQRLSDRPAQNFETQLAPQVRQLVTLRENAEKKLAEMDAVESNDRQTAIDAIEILIGQYISPLIEHYRQSDSSVEPFDLDTIAGGEFRGLLAGLFGEKLKEETNGLQKPNDKFLKEALEYIGIPIANDERRDRFFRSWAGLEAISTVGALISFLEKPLFGQHPAKIDGATTEQKRLENIMQSSLPSGLKYSLESFAERLNRGK